MTYQHWFLLDLRHLSSKFDIMSISEISNVVFLVYSSDLSIEDLTLLRSKCKNVLCFVPISPNIDIIEFLLYLVRTK